MNVFHESFKFYYTGTTYRKTGPDFNGAHPKNFKKEKLFGALEGHGCHTSAPSWRERGR